MRVLVTGASGFIGCHTVRALLADGHSVAAVARERGPLTRLHDVSQHVRVMHADLRDAEGVGRHLTAFRPEAVVHLAWYAEPGKYLHSRENVIALRYSLDLIDAVAAAGCERFVGAGTCAEYRTDRRVLREDDATDPSTMYAAAKLALC